MAEPLTIQQLEIIAHIANGDRLEDAAKKVHLSTSATFKTVRVAKKKMGANSLPHLISLVIAHGYLEWEQDTKKRVKKVGKNKHNKSDSKS